MTNLRSLPLCAALCALVCASSSVLAGAQARAAAPLVRIVNRIDNSQLTTLKGNVNPHAIAKNDRGAVDAALPMTDMILVLSRDSAQQAAFDAYVASEYDPNSPNYHQWLTPDQVGENFGPSETDIATVTNWLTGQGFTVSEVTKDRMSIRFSGTAAQVQSAFHTEIHNLQVKGRMHIANMTDPQIPAALAPVVVGVKGLHNFFPHPLHHMGHMVQRDASGMWKRQPLNLAASGASSAPLRPLVNAPAESGKTLPQFGISVSGTDGYLVEDVSPWDFATIYNVTKLWNAGIDGTGQTIAIAGTSAIDIGESSSQVAYANGNNDVATFRTFFDLPTNNPQNTPIQVSGNSHPLEVCTDTSGTQPCGIDDLLENSLDVEWSGSIAKNAQIVLVASYPASDTDDNLYDSESYIVNNVGNPSSPVYGVHVMNVSYGECELGEGNSGNLEYYNLWEQAASEGIAVFVAAGDSGAASCDDGGDEGGENLPYVAEYGLSVSGLASTPFDTAVGGTDFNWCSLDTDFTSECSASPYWSSTQLTPPGGSNPSYSALGYVPEVPWNDTCTNTPLALSGLEWLWNSSEAYDTPYYGSGNQTYTVTDAETACNAFVYWEETNQQADEQIYEDGLLPMVDTVGGSGGRSNCVSNNTVNDLGTTTYSQGTVSSCGTATSIQNGSSTIRLTNDGWQKPSWQTGVPGIPSDGVRDIPDVSFFASDGYLSSSAYLICVSQDSSGYGSGNQPCSYSSSEEPFAQEVGGTSVATPAMAGVMALIDQKAGAAQGNPNQQLYALAAKQTYSSCSSESATTGDGCYFNDIDQGTIAMACDYDAFVTTPSPNCTIAHAGDYVGILTGYSATTGYDLASGLGSLNVANVVNAWTATAGLATPTVKVTPPASPVNSADTITVTVSVSGSAGTPSGTITLSGGGYTSAAETIGTSPCASATSCVFTIPANTFTTAGTVTLTATYNGDADYTAESGQGSVTVTVASLLTPTVTVKPASQTLNSEGAFTVTVTVSGSGATPTGTVTLSSGSYNSGAQTLTNGSYTFTIGSAGSQTPLATGTDTLTASYSGDPNYGSATGTAQVTVTESTFTLTPGSPSSSSVTPGQSATVAVAVAPVAGYTGTVSLSCAQSSTTATGGDGTACTGSGNSQVNLATCSGSSCNVTFTISTYAPQTAALERPQVPGSGKGGWLGAGGGAVLALLVFFGIPSRRKSWQSMLGILVATVSIGFMASCGGGVSNGGGGGGQSDPGTTAGTYTYTVTATPSPSVSPVVTTTFTVTVN